MMALVMVLLATKDAELGFEPLAEDHEWVDRDPMRHRSRFNPKRKDSTQNGGVGVLGGFRDHIATQQIHTLCFVPKSTIRPSLTKRVRTSLEGCGFRNQAGFEGCFQAGTWRKGPTGLFPQQECAEGTSFGAGAAKAALPAAKDVPAVSGR